MLLALAAALLLAHPVWALRALADFGRPSTCNGGQGSWVWNTAKDPAEYYNISNETDSVDDAQEAFEPTREVPFLKAFMWEWTPKNAACVFSKMNLRTFCAAMKKHHLTRCMMVGDSLTFMMAQSFWGLLHQPSRVGDQKLGHMEHNIRCPQGNVLFVYVRNDHLDNATTKPTTRHRYWSPWWGPFVHSPLPTLLVANSGVHSHSIEDFRRDFDSFVKGLENFSPQGRADQWYFRLTTPGHESCWKYDKPLTTPRDFHLDGPMAKKYTWDLVPAFNQYVFEKLASLTVPLQVLDAYELTIMRPDGHRGPSKDCLHYYLPGVVDWWNHLLVTLLLA